MLVCTIYILVGMAFTTTIIELVRYEKDFMKITKTVLHNIGENMQKVGGKCRS